MFRVLLFAILMSLTLTVDHLAFGESNDLPPLVCWVTLHPQKERLSRVRRSLSLGPSHQMMSNAIPPYHQTDDRILGSATSGIDGSYEVRWNQPTLPGHEEFEPRFFLYRFFILCGVPLQRSLLLNEPGDFRATIQLSSGVPYESRVVDKKGRPVAGAKVRLEFVFKDVESTKFLSKVEGQAYCFMDLSETLTATTNEKGEFKFPSLPRCGVCSLASPTSRIPIRITYSNYDGGGTKSTRRAGKIHAGGPGLVERH